MFFPLKRVKALIIWVLLGAIVIFSIICIYSEPIINGIIPLADSWKTKNCKKFLDDYKETKKSNNKDFIETAKKDKNNCNREKAKYELEFSSLIIDIICRFIYTILGLLSNLHWLYFMYV